MSLVRRVFRSGRREKTGPWEATARLSAEAAAAPGSATVPVGEEKRLAAVP